MVVVVVVHTKYKDYLLTHLRWVKLSLLDLSGSLTKVVWWWVGGWKPNIGTISSLISEIS